MRTRTLNLARRPFSNQAPVLRVGLLLAVLGLTLLFFNVQRYRNYFAGRGEAARNQLSEIDGRIRGLDRELEELQGELQQYDIEALNARVAFLNLRIQERVFGWSRLFEDLEAVVPTNVRLSRLSPRQLGESGSAVALAIQGVAQSEEGLLNLVDALFAHERFRNPNPSRQAERRNQHEFTLSVLYLPPQSQADAEVEEEAPEEGS
jgi:Tfp pilus assembly protein PilN